MDLDMFESIKQKLNLSSMSKPALIGIVALLALVAVVAGARFLGTATASEFEVSKDAEASDYASNGGDGESSQNEAQTIYVHVSGAVATPGLCELDDGSRVADAIRKAGGFTDDADQISVNLARPVTDGEQIIVARVSEQGSAVALEPSEARQNEGGSNQSTQSAGGLVNINTANEAQLESLPGIGEAIAARIVADRQNNGPFKTKEDLMRVSGIGAKKYEALADAICL